MPFKDYQEKLEYQRRYYNENEEQRQKQIERVRRRKWGAYSGTCLVCGAGTMGTTKGKAAEFCSKPECASVQRREMLGQIKVKREEKT